MPTRGCKRMARFTFALLSLGLALAPASAAQTVPFGKNKVQYTHFEWRVLSGPRIDVYYYPEEEDLARMALAHGEAWFDVLEERFQHHPFRRVPLVVYSSHQHFEQTNLTRSFIPEGVLGFTEFLKRRVALPFRGSYAQFRSTLRHELVHFFDLSKLTETYALHGRVRSAGIPHWWREGLAEFWSGPQDSQDEMVIRDVVLGGNLPDLRSFTYSATFLSYPLGGELFHYLTDRFGEDHIVELYDKLWKYDSFEDAFQYVFGRTLEELDREWRYHLEKRYFPVYAEREPLGVGTEPVVVETGPNFKPLVQVLPGDSVPQLFYMSPRTGYTNIYHTDLQRGERGARVMVGGERSAEFESLHPFESRMDITAEGMLVFVSKFLEGDALFIWDVARSEVVGRYQWDDLVGLQSPSWSPDGRRVVFSGLSSSGPSDLYVLDFDTGQRTALTADLYEDADPDWSPDGRFIVFSSDRTPYGVDGAINLYLYELELEELRYLTFGDWKDADPRWSNAGDRIAFSSNRSGFLELYSVDVHGTGDRVSAFSGGALDPEWLPDDSGLIFTGYSEGTFLLYRQPLDGTAAGPPLVALGPSPDAPTGTTSDGRASTDGALYPTSGSTPNGNGALAALPAANEPSWEWETLDWEVEPAEEGYSPKNSFSLDFAGGEALIAPGVGSAQGIQFLGSDMLGNNVIFLGLTAIQTDFSNLADAFSGQLLYLNLKRRLSVGGGIFRFSGLFRDVSFNVYEEESYGGFFLASYPFSKFKRLELQLGAERSNRLDREDFFRLDTREDPRNLTREAVLSRAFLSFVKDNTLWLPFGPVDGGRYNVTVGLVTDLSNARAENWVVMADWRTYLRTSLRSAIALRGFGYYSGGAIPGRAVLGGPHMLRGYPRLTLAGSRVWLANTEWRFPLINSLALNLPVGNITFPGIQGALFTDLGSSWLEGQSPEGSWGSYGFGFRWGIGYPLILRLDVGKRYRIGDEPPLFFNSNRAFDDGFVDFFFGFNF